MKRKQISLLFAVSLLILFLAGCGDSTIVKKSFKIDDDAQIEIVNPHGNIDVITYCGNQVEVWMVKKNGNKTTLEKSGIKIEPNRKSFRILVAEKNQAPGISIDYRLKIPEKTASVTLTAGSGNIDAVGVFQKIKLVTTNGRINFRGDFTGSSSISANGDIDFYVHKILQGDIDIKSTNGNINVLIDSDSAFRADGFTATGEITGNFEIRVKKDTRGRRFEATANEGTHRVSLHTVNGSINLKKR